MNQQKLRSILYLTRFWNVEVITTGIKKTPLIHVIVITQDMIS